MLLSYCHALGAIKRGLQTLDPSSGDQEVLQDILETSHKIQHFVDSIIGRRQLDHTQQLGGAVSGKLVRGEKESTIEKRHLIIARVLRQRAEENQIQFINMGSDYSYPFYDAYKPTQNALRALSENTSKALHYPSSFGLESLRQAFQRFMHSRFGVNLDWKKEIMINTGASQAFDALSRAFEAVMSSYPRFLCQLLE
jgi:DNA-binding transcriptional MocR family regulator